MESMVSCLCFVVGVSINYPSLLLVRLVRIIRMEAPETYLISNSEIKSLYFCLACTTITVPISQLQQLSS